MKNRRFHIKPNITSVYNQISLDKSIEKPKENIKKLKSKIAKKIKNQAKMTLFEFSNQNTSQNINEDKENIPFHKQQNSRI
mmetsp:Transcript_17025/g.14967  ORF Transcript_17025/g.14967 Transcript_17025/m.14967 type:complete len:81 (+) Transcript_17025:825-1067(+)